MRKKILALMLVASMSMGLVGCGGNGGSPTQGEIKSESKAVSGETEPFEFNGITYNKATDLTQDNIELTYFHFDQEQTVEYLADRFEQIYPNIKVYPVYEPVGTYNDTLTSLMSNHDSPDVIMYSDCDFALSNFLLSDISAYWDSDPETKEVASTINDCGIGCYSTSARFSVPVKFFPTGMYIDLNVLKTLNIDPPSRNWTWDEMIDLIKKATVKDSPDGTPYFGCGYYNRLDSYYGIAASQDIVGEFGFDGTEFNLSVWAIGEQQFSDLKLSGNIAPESKTIEMENWLGNWEGWCGSSSHCALFTEAFWTYQNTWGIEDFSKQYNMDVIPYVVPAVSEADAKADHHSIATIDFGGITPSCQYPREAYELLKFMSFGKDGWKTRIEMYDDETIVNASGVALKHDVMPAPITTDQEVWDAYINMYCKGMDEEHVGYWREYFKSCLQPIPYGWTSIAGYWTYCDQYFNDLNIHSQCDTGQAKAADFADDATRKANYFHAKAMLDYFGSSGYDILTDEEVAKYEEMSEANK